VTGAWRLLATSLVAGLSVLFAVLYLLQRRRVRYQLRNRLTPLTVLNDQPAPIERRVRWGIVGVVLVVTLALLALGGSEASQG